MGHVRFPIPFGWFQIAEPDEVPPGTVRALRYFGRDLVCWADEAGEVHLQDAFCPHLGAHLGVGGVVDRGALRCPFHGWRFDASGACCEIPYSRRLNRKAKLRTYPVIRRNGLVMAWYHPDPAVPPAWDIPELPEVGSPEFSDYYTSSYVVAAPWQELGENAVDPAHFRYVHGTDQVATLQRYETDGPRFVMISEQSYVTPRGVVIGHIDSYGFGPGFNYVWFTGIVDALLVATTTPIDEGSVQVRFHFTVRKLGDERSTSTVADAFVAEINKQLTEDIPIWEHKVHLPNPALADTDGPIMQYRRWCRQFYPDGVPAAPEVSGPGSAGDAGRSSATTSAT